MVQMNLIAFILGERVKNIIVLFIDNCAVYFVLFAYELTDYWKLSSRSGKVINSKLYLLCY